MCTRPISIKVPCNPYEYSLGYRGFKQVTVPCGKCPECLMKRQKDISARAYREALRYPTCWHVIFTYDWCHVPFSHTLLDTNLGTGEQLVSRVAGLEIDTATLEYLRSDYRKYRGNDCYYFTRRLVTISANLSNDGCIHDYDIVYTPTLSYRDFSLMVKNFRIDYQRKVGELDWKYICVGEYGSAKHHSHRPHFHVLIFGLSEMQLDYLIGFWNKGNVVKKPVKFINEDGTSGIAKVAAYIGKYAAKGSFVPSSVKNKFTIKCRLSASRGLGLSDLEQLINYYRCYDMFKYDIELCDYPTDKQSLLFEEILKRLQSYEFPGSKKPISLPISFVKQIFGFRVIDGKACWSKLYYQFMDFARVRNQIAADEIFFDFIDCRTKEGIPFPLAVAQYADIQKSALQNRESREKEIMSKLYTN